MALKRRPAQRDSSPTKRPSRRSSPPPTRSAPPRRAAAPSAPRSAPGAAGERLQKVLAHAGLGSRRTCEELILQGRVTVNGQVARELGTRVDPDGDQIAVDGQPVRQERLVYFAVHKPRGYVSTNADPSGRPRVIDLLPGVAQRVFAIGRLDEDSSGLILLTNDGDLANRLAHPRYGVEKIYRVLVAGEPDEEDLRKLKDGVWLAEGKARAKRVRQAGRQGQATLLEMVLAEGKNREVRRMLAKLGHKVMSLTRIAVGPISLKGLKPGDHRPLTRAEVDLLRRAAAGELVRPPDRAPRGGRTGGPPKRRERGPAPARPPRPGAGPPPSSSRPAGPAPRLSGSGGEPAPGRPPRRSETPPAAPSAPRPKSKGPAVPRPGATGRPARTRSRDVPPPSQPQPMPRVVIGLDEGPGSAAGKPSGRKPMPKRRPRPIAKPRRQHRDLDEGND